MSKSRGYVVKKSELTFFLSYIIFLTFMTLSTSFYYKYFMDEMKLIILGCCLILLVGETINRKLDNTALKGTMICFALFLIVFFVSKGATENSVAAIFLYIYTSRNIEFEKIAKISFYVFLALLLIVIASSLVGIIDNTLLVKSGRSRWCLGFRYVLYAPSLYFNIACLWAYLNQDRKKRGLLIETIILFALNYWLYHMTNSRITFTMTCLILLMPYIIGKKSKKRNFAYRKWKVFIPCYIVCFFTSVLFTIFYNSSIPWMRKLNEFLSQRLILGRNSIIQNGIGLFGKKLTMIGNGMDAYGKISTDAFANYTYVDSLYIQMLIHYGTIFTIIYLVIMTIALYKSYKQENRMAMLIFALIGFHCMIDDMQLYLQYNTFWLLAGHFLMNETIGISKIRIRRGYRYVTTN